ncbi:MAG: hypothetical protein HY756_05860 [Nitrospirae bacterium]|nr:hypothetical protein [Nitrospirota bacterium]
MKIKYSNKSIVTSNKLKDKDSSLVTRHSSLSTVAFLWDESFLWGLMAYKTLTNSNLPFDLIRSADIKAGALKDYKLLFIPGGWASNKLKAFGEDGIKEVKKFVKSGGNYLGFCGGAGLATEDGIGLLNVKRKPTKDRVPSFNGRIYLNINKHPIWMNTVTSNELRVTSRENFLNSSLVTRHSSRIFNAWWPSQFLVDDKEIKILAAYGEALPDAFSSDLNVGDTEENGDWQAMEEIYKINLDPKRLKDEPAVIEGNFGKGKVILSLIHFDTIDDDNGAMVLRNLWEYLAEQNTEHRTQNTDKFPHPPFAKGGQGGIKDSLGSELCVLCSDLINLGIRNFLWYWRNPMLLQWRRGVRGLEYCTLYVMIKEIVKMLRGQGSEVRGQKLDLERVKKLLMPFAEKARQLLILERLAMQNGYITYEKCDDPKIQEIRAELFGNSKSHGGMFKALIDRIDGLLYRLITQKCSEGNK